LNGKSVAPACAAPLAAYKRGQIELLKEKSDQNHAWLKGGYMVVWMTLLS